MTQDEMLGWHHQLNGPMDMSLSKLLEIVKDREDWHAAVREVTKSRTATDVVTSSQLQPA